MKKTQKDPEAGRRAESKKGPTPRPKGEAQGARQAGRGLAAPIPDSGNSAFRRSSVRSEVPLITKALRVEIAYPVRRCHGGRSPEVPCTWDELGPELRRYRAAMHHIYNGTMLDSLLEKHAGRELFELGGKSRTYQIAILKAKANKLDACGLMMSALGREVDRKLQKWAKDGKRDRPPFYKYGAPIPVPEQVSDVTIEGSAVLLKIKLGGEGHWILRVAASKGTHWAKLREIATGEVKRGAIKLIYDERRRKWYAIIAYSEPEPAATALNAANVLVLHRGQHNWLTAMSNTGDFKYLDRGNKYLVMRRGLEARRRQIRGIVEPERGSGAKGHGRDRRFATYERLGDYLARFNHTKCQQLAAEVVKLCHEWGCGRVVIEDYGGIQPSNDRNERRFVEKFPLAELKMAIAWALRKDGIPLDEVSSEYISNECPRCCTVHVERDACHTTSKRSDKFPGRERVFHCRACAYERPADFVAALHMLRRSGADMSEWDRRFAQLRDLETSVEVVRTGESEDQRLAEEPAEPQKGGARKPVRKPSKSRSLRRVGVEA